MSWFISCPVPIGVISSEEYEAIKAAGELIVADRMAPKVMRKSGGNLLKFFRRKRLISSAMIMPYAIRFARNALRLQQLGIPTVNPLRIWHCPAKGMHIVEYEPLPGELLRENLTRQPDNNLLENTACFIAELHHKGVYFRSLHFENIVVHNSQLGLIDVADMKIYTKPLNNNLRKRNFQHFLRYPADKAIIDQYGLTAFQDKYDECAKRNNG